MWVSKQQTVSKLHTVLGLSCCRIKVPTGSRVNRVHRVQMLASLAPSCCRVWQVVAQHVALLSGAACAGGAGAAGGAAHAQLTHAAVAADGGPHARHVGQLAVKLVVRLEGILCGGRRGRQTGKEEAGV